ncbi:MAG: DHHA1 domain-containing protein, partial [Oscillospiraceae bacterium]
EGHDGIVVLDETPLYAEMGGQIADHGTITAGESVFTVTDVQKTKGGKYLHHGTMTRGSLSVENKVTANLDTERRRAIRRAHSATHLLDKALATVLGDHVHQAGSLVEPDHLRFDFTHFAALTAEELSKVEELVNVASLEGYPITVEELPIEEARKKGAVALFGEKYGDKVRVVDMGGYSVEFCGGTHLDNTAKVGPFRIDSEFSVASGVRRIEATVGMKCIASMKENRSLLHAAAETLKTKPQELLERMGQQLAEMRDLRHVVEQFKQRDLLTEADRFLFSAKPVGTLKVVTATLRDQTADSLRVMGDFLRDKAPNVVAVLSMVTEGKITFLAVCGKNAIEKGVKAGDLVKTVTAICGGTGGGKPDSAMGGGKDILKLDDALAAVDDFVAGKLGL